MNIRAATFVFILLSVFSFAAIDICAATLTVTKIEDTNDGVCDADCSLREAVVAAIPDDTITFSELFNKPQTITLTLGQIAFSKNLTITGTGQDLLTISGNNADRIFFITGSTVTVNISGITFRDGNGHSPTIGIGGAIRVIDITLNVSNATFTNNRTGSESGGGGAIAADGNSNATFSNLLVYGNIGGSAISSTASMDIRDSLVTQNTGGGGVTARTLNVERCVVSDNTGPYAIGVGAVHLTIIDSTVTGSTGGGVSDGDATSTMTIERCLISGNSRYPGGGGVDASGTTIIKDSQIINNTASADFGGGIANGGTLYLIGSLVSGNRNTGGGFGEDGGGGILSYGNRGLFVINSTVSGNTAMGGPGAGGGIYLLDNGASGDPILTVTNSTISNNQARGGGGGIRVDNGGTATIQNSIIAGNNSTGTSQEDVSGIMTSNGINLIGNTTGSSGWIAGDLLNVDPRLGPLADNGGNTLTHELLNCSPAINAGNNSLAIDPQTQLPLTGDQRGFPRFVGRIVDIGAYEANYDPCLVTPTPTNTPTSTPTITPTNTPTDTPTNTPTATATSTPTATPTATGSPACTPGTLYDQTDNAAITATSSQNFEAALDNFDDQVADDFVVPAGQTWNVSQVNVAGQYFNGIGQADSVNVFFYPNAGTLPGAAAACTYNNVAIASGAATGAFNIRLPSGCVLSEGTYWVSVQANMDFNPNGQWGWNDRTVQSNAGAAFRNPGGAFACPGGNDWLLKTTCVAGNTPDQAFLLIGTTGGCRTLAGLFDYDGDHRSDISVFRPDAATWYIQRSLLGPYGIAFGLATDKIVPADYDGDGKTDIAVYRPESGIWYVLNSLDGTVSYFVFGLAEDLPTPADYDGDGRADVSVFRPSTGTWYRRNSSDGTYFGMQFGDSEDKPTVGDFDGDGKADLAVFRPSVGDWYQLYSSDNSLHGRQFGFGSDVIVQADYDGDGKTDLAVFRPSNSYWYIANSSNGTVSYSVFGLGNDIPAAGDFDGDGKADLSVFRPSNGTWYRLNSSDGSTFAYQFGTNGDKPTQTAFRY